MAMVLQEEQRPICSNNNNSGATATATTKSSKKSKQKKTPQRGMGVAQLEELRMREQQKIREQQKSAAASSSSSIILPTLQQPPSLPFLTAGSDPNPLLSRCSLPTPSTAINFMGSNTNFMGSNTIESTERGNLTMLCSEPFASQEMVARKYNLLTNLQTVPSALVQRRQHPPQQQQQQFVLQAVSKRLPPSSSSGVNLQIEPPSNQSYYSNNYHHMPPTWPEEDKVVGIKRPWPFHPDNLSSHNIFHCRVPVFRETSSSSSVNHADFQSHNHPYDKSNKLNCVTTDDGFLTLAPCFPSSQGSTDEGLSQSAISSEPPFYSFLPMGPDGHETSSDGQQSDTPDGVDLNLKL